MDRRKRLKQFWHSFTGRMILGVFLLHVLLTPMLFYGILLIVERSFESQFIDQVRNDSLLYASLMKPAAEIQNIQKQKAFLDEAQFSGHVVFVKFTNNDGVVVRADTVGSTVKTVFKEDFYFGEHADDIYYIAIQLFSDLDSRLLGSLELGYDELSIQERIDTVYRYGSLAAVGYIVLSMLLVIFFGRLLIRPVSSLRNLAKSIAAGNHTIDLNVNTDISELKLLADDLEIMRQNLMSKQKDILDRELHLEAILDNASEGIITTDESGIIQSFNQAAESIFGYTTDQVVGGNVSVLMPTPHQEKHNDYLVNYLQTGDSKVIGYGRRVQAQHKDGSLMPIHLTISKVQQGMHSTFTGIMHDLSREEKKEAELQRLWRAVEQSPVSIMITNADGNIEYVNPSFYQVTGYRAEEVLGENPRFLKSGQTSEEAYQDLWGTIGKGGIWRGVFQNKKKDGESFWLSSTVCPVRDQEGEITHYISINEDITEARKKEGMLAQAMKLEAIGRMTDGIAHDFNNLLTIIRGNLKLLAQDINTEDEDINELLEDALSAAQDGADLIKRLMTFSRRQELKAQTVDINKSLYVMERLLQRSVPDTDIRMELNYEIGKTFIDANRLESAVLNLLTNARDAMPDGGIIIISTGTVTVDKTEREDDLTPGKYVVLTITDNGIGMNPATKRQAIEPFFTTKTVETGTGLGLTMVNEFVQQCGGKLDINSSPGKGTSIELLFPSIENEAAVEWITENELVEDLPRGKETILVVEDMEKVRRFACRTLIRLGYKTYEAENATEAIKQFQQYHHIDLLFTDIVMPGDSNGRDLAHIVMETWPDTKILLTTGMEPANDKEPRNLEDIPIIYKPYYTEQLAQKIRTILDTVITN